MYEEGACMNAPPPRFLRHALTMQQNLGRMMADLAVAEGEEVEGNGSPKKKELKIIKKKGFQQDSACQVGAPCLKCGASCPGLSLHMWRKRCTHCWCNMELHVLLSKEEKEKQKGKGGSFKYAWQPPGLELEKLVKFMDSLPKDCVPRLGTKGAVKRQELLARQHPVYDVELDKCHPMTKLEQERFHKFVERRERKHRGQAILAQVEPTAPVELCRGCGGDILHGEFYVYTEMQHAGPNWVWHPACFQCEECKEFIADFKYYFGQETDGIFCGRCHGELQVKRCFGCDELIFLDTYTEALGKKWHKNHFCCWYCDVELGGGKRFMHVSDKIVCCPQCYDEHQADDCDSCGKPISVGDKKLRAQGKFWHEACFHCFLCRTPLKDKPFYSEQGHLFCGKCIIGGLTSCSACEGVIGARDTCIQYESYRWHSQCFKCIKCEMALSGEEFVLKDKKIRCRECYKHKSGQGTTRCVACKNEITEKGIKFRGKPYHHNCFRCTHCKKGLMEETPLHHDDKPYCKECHIQQFGKRCTKCVKPILSKYTIYKARPFHRECFICTRCSMPMSSDSFYESQHGDLFCESCAVYM